MADEIGFEVHLHVPYSEAIGKVVAALKQQGFGVLTQIDVRATLKEKLGVDFRPYAILGACNPPLAHQALTENPQVGLLLPCNVTVESDESSGSLVRIANPEVMLTVGSLSENAILCDVAFQARQRLESVANALRES